MELQEKSLFFVLSERVELFLADATDENVLSLKDRIFDNSRPTLS